jgi:hypothetical protein
MHQTSKKLIISSYYQHISAELAIHSKRDANNVGNSAPTAGIQKDQGLDINTLAVFRRTMTMSTSSAA